MAPLFIGYARVSTDEQDLTAQHDALTGLGVSADRIYVDRGLTISNRERRGLREALAACREGDTLVVTKLDRLARSLPDAREILDDLTARSVKLSLGGSVHDPTDPVGRLLFDVLAMVAGSKPTSSGCAPAKARPKDACAASSPSSTATGSRPRRSPPHRPAQRRGARRPVRRRALDRLPRHAARPATPGRREVSYCRRADSRSPNGTRSTPTRR